MAAPNIVNVSTITGITTGRELTTSTTASMVMNPASSGKVFKVNSVVVSNIDGSSSVNITVSYYDGSSTFDIANVVPLASGTSRFVVDKNSALYLEEGCQLRAGASANSDADITITYEEIS